MSQALVAAQLKEKGIVVAPGWLEAALAYLVSIGESPSVTSVYQQFLCSDLQHSCAGTLPPNVDTFHKQVLAGSHVLQVNEIFNAGASLEHREQENSGRMLKLSLTDGRSFVVGFEYRRLPTSIHIKSKLGIKVRVKDVMVRRGLLMLQPQNTEILGGSVASLCDEQERRQKEKRSKRDASTSFQQVEDIIRPPSKKPAYPSRTGGLPRATSSSPNMSPPAALTPVTNISSISNYFHKQPAAVLTRMKEEQDTKPFKTLSAEVVDLVEDSTEDLESYFDDVDDELFAKVLEQSEREQQNAVPPGIELLKFLIPSQNLSCRTRVKVSSFLPSSNFRLLIYPKGAIVNVHTKTERGIITVMVTIDDGSGARIDASLPIEVRDSLIARGYSESSFGAVEGVITLDFVPGASPRIHTIEPPSSADIRSLIQSTQFLL